MPGLIGSGIIHPNADDIEWSMRDNDYGVFYRDKSDSVRDGCADVLSQDPDYPAERICSYKAEYLAAAVSHVKV